MAHEQLWIRASASTNWLRRPRPLRICHFFWGSRPISILRPPEMARKGGYLANHPQEWPFSRGSWAATPQKRGYLAKSSPTTYDGHNLGRSWARIPSARGATAELESPSATFHRSADERRAGGLKPNGNWACRAPSIDVGSEAKKMYDLDECHHGDR